MIGDRDWKNVDWHWVRTEFDRKVTVSATVNGTEIRSYEFDTIWVPFNAAVLIKDLLTALRQHRGQE